MAQDNKRNPSGKGGGKPTAGQAPQPARKPAGRQSVAAARNSSGNNRTQLIIGIVAVAVILVIIVGGVIFTQQQSQVQADGYGPSTQSVATVEADGVVAVTKQGVTPPITIDIYADALCPICAQFETQFGQQIGQAIDEGKLAVNYHMLKFLDSRSFSGTYSTRAAAALLCVAEQDGDQPGVYLAMHTAVFSPDSQPEESGTADLTNEQLAEMATAAGAGNSVNCINSGQNEDAAAASAAASSATLTAATGRVATPTVLYNGAPIGELAVDWLTTLLAAQ